MEGTASHGAMREGSQTHQTEAAGDDDVWSGSFLHINGCLVCLLIVLLLLGLHMMQTDAKKQRGWGAKHVLLLCSTPCTVPYYCMTGEGRKGGPCYERMIVT